ncbi:hypothetical protein [Amycolatopsis sp. H20-H5]|uniref:hypothetical protein n=1 Tax=Amycolatopsis sp. H20-H5 TaxID=3046309 RepID=UPI002DB769D2|nr:hypothetical protein [Amycolatopsis sp. H20-H5]MEC3974591.1 hypothetical protein [Amycolatopsis sp. H20-H5]
MSATPTARPAHSRTEPSWALHESVTTDHARLLRPTRQTPKTASPRKGQTR